MIVYDLPDIEYHARPELSSTGVRRILDSPARFRWEQTNRVEKTAYDVGHALHAKVLGTGPRVIPIPDEHLTPSGAVSTKAATVAWLTEQRANGVVPIAPADAERIDRMAEAILAHKGARTLLELPGRSEVSVFATDPETGVECRARFDRLTDDHALAIDVKTTTGRADSVSFGREAARFGYPVQEAHYADVLEWETSTRIPVLWIVVEKSAPHLVAVHEFSEVARLVARDLTARARETYAECLATDTWPGYADETYTTDLPAWWHYQAEDETEMEFS